MNLLRREVMRSKEKKNKKSVLVLGAGIAGVSAASRLGRSGVEVHLVEKEVQIGGHVVNMGCKAGTVCVRCNVCVADEILRGIDDVPNVNVHTSSQLLRLTKGSNGKRYTAVIEKPDSKMEIDVDALIVATGFEDYDPSENSAYHYDGVANLITGIEAEKQLAETQKLVRVSDVVVPERIAFVQCVGSRTEEIHRRPDDTNYCSTVCCTYALRIGRLLKERVSSEAEVTVFYMDIQNFGKGFDKFYKECKDLMRFVRSRPYEITEGSDGEVLVKYTNPGDNHVMTEVFDLVVLSVGIRPGRDWGDLSDKLGVTLDENGFFGIKGVSAFGDLQRKGIYAAGACQGPKDIAGSIAQAKAVSAAVLSEG